MDCYANKPSRGALREIVDRLEAMIEETVEYALEHKASQKTLHRVFYERYRDQYPWMPTGVIKGPIEMLLEEQSLLERLRKGIELIPID
jgi:hypothetical protein